MPNLTFYRQKRSDGGVRTGIQIDNDTVFSHFEEVDEEYDPTLLWYVDLRCQGQGLPDDPEAARQWLLDHEEIIEQGFERYAQEIRTGFDPDLYPLEWGHFDNLPEGVQARIVCSAIRRIDALNFSEVLRDIGAHWRDRIEDLARYAESGR